MSKKKLDPIDAQLIKGSAGLWKTFKDVDTDTVIKILYNATRRVLLDAGKAATDKEIKTHLTRDLSTICWCANGFPTIQVGHKIAANLMTADYPVEIQQKLQLPWQCFCIKIPDGLLTTDRFNPRRILLNKTKGVGDEEACAGLIFEDGQNFYGISGFRTGELVDPNLTAGLDEEAKIAHLAFRLAAGVICILTNINKGAPNPGEVLERVDKARHEKEEKGIFDPSPLLFKLGMNIELDNTEHIRSYLTGKTHKFMVRWTVRKHLRWVLKGKGNEKKQVQVWVREHKKGPEGAPMVIRDHNIPDSP